MKKHSETRQILRLKALLAEAAKADQELSTDQYSEVLDTANLPTNADFQRVDNDWRRAIRDEAIRERKALKKLLAFDPQPDGPSITY